MTISRVYVEKDSHFDVEAKSIKENIRTALDIKGIEELRLFNCYDVEGLTDEEFELCCNQVFSEVQCDVLFTPQEFDRIRNSQDWSLCFSVEYLPGQFDMRAHSAIECVQILTSKKACIVCSKIYLISGCLKQEDAQRIKNYLVNPVESQLSDNAPRTTLSDDTTADTSIPVLNGFNEYSDDELASFLDANGLAMDYDDLHFIQNYFAQSLHRQPTLTEIKLIDTYWSDHCRHTTFNTELDEIDIQDSQVERAFETYKQLREKLGRQDKPITLMDLGTIAAKYHKSVGLLNCLDESEEINACTIKAKVDVNGQIQDWLYLFKNETHNHPTEVEPFGGAATCVGGAIRDPLSGRSFVYHAMRVTGAADPTQKVSDTMPSKLSQYTICKKSASGFSSYGNQIGLATGMVHEFYHPNYVAKRLEVGAVCGAAPAKNVVREKPIPGDVIILLGGKTGRDGIGGATGSSKAHTSSSILTCGAEVQKGNAPEERKLQRLFRNEAVSKMIKRCNDFGAGGVSVACGELSDSMDIYLERVPLKYKGLTPTEIAISESQERMAVVVARENLDEFLKCALAENIEATHVADITDSGFLRMTYNGEVFVELERSFLDTNGVAKHAKIEVEDYKTAQKPSVVSLTGVDTASDFSAWDICSKFGDGNQNLNIEERLIKLVGDINIASSIGLGDTFDSNIGASSVLAPFGGKYLRTKVPAMVSLLPVEGKTTTVSGMSFGFNPHLSLHNQYLGGYNAVLESLCKLVAVGFNPHDVLLTFQEYYGKLKNDPKKWGRPFASLLGALQAQVDFGLSSIGGKDSMSGSFEDIDVPPTLISFATALGDAKNIISNEFKQAGHNLFYLCAKEDDARSQAELLDFIYKNICHNNIFSASTVGYGGAFTQLFNSCIGNELGLDLSQLSASELDDLFKENYGAFIIEVEDDFALAGDLNFELKKLGSTIDDFAIITTDENINLQNILKVWQQKLHGVYPYIEQGDAVASIPPMTSKTETISTVFARQEAAQQHLGDGNLTVAQQGDGNLTVAFSQSPQTQPSQFAKPRVLIPVFPGTNCEYDSARAFEFAGAKPEVFIVNNQSLDKLNESIEAFANKLSQTQIVMIPGGFSGADEPDGSAKFICSFFRNSKITDNLRKHIIYGDGLILGICNGFQALIKLGLVPFGDIIEQKMFNPTLTFNTIGRHVSKYVNTRIVNNISPWLNSFNPGDIHTIPISHGEGRFVAEEKVIKTLIDNGQIATQYCDLEGKSSMHSSINPNGSMYCIEGITSIDGRIFGKMGHSERTGKDLAKNITGNKYQAIFENGVNYFA